MDGHTHVQSSRQFQLSVKKSLGAVCSPGTLSLLGGLAALRAVTYLLQGFVSVSLLPDFAVQGNTGGIGLAIVGAAIDALIWIAVLKLAIEAMFDAHEFVGSDRSKAEVVTDRAAVSLAAILLVSIAPTYLALLREHIALAVLGAAAALLYLPVAVHLVAFGSLADALSPLAWAEFARRRTALVWQAPLFVALVMLALCLAWLLLEPILPTFALAVLSRFCTYASIVLCCAFIGAVSRTGDGEVESEPDDTYSTPEEVDALALAENPASEAERQAAMDALAYLVRCGTSEKIHDRFRRLLLEAGEREKLLKHGVHYVGVLMQSGRHGKALSVFEESLSQNEVVPFQDPGDCSLLAMKALDLNRRTTAYELAKTFESLFPSHSWAVEAKILKARLGVEQFGKIEQGILTLSGVIAAQPERDADGRLSALVREWRSVATD